jgi:hypothetical protein
MINDREESSSKQVLSCHFLQRTWKGDEKCLNQDKSAGIQNKNLPNIKWELVLHSVKSEKIRYLWPLLTEQINT